MTTASSPLLLLLLLIIPATFGFGWTATSLESRGTQLFAIKNNDDDESKATPLPFSASDLERLSMLRSRQKEIPIMILDAMLPGQSLEFSLSDKRFRVLAKRLLTQDDQLGMIGFDPATGMPLNVGVTVKVNKLDVGEEICILSIEGDQMFEVQGEPQIDETKSYYKANVELGECGGSSDLSKEDQREAEKLHKEIPALIQQWLQWLYKTGRATQGSMKPRFPTGDMPDEIGERAVWAAALVNPLPALGVCLEIRPSMLLCRNDLERVRLAHASLQASIDHLSGKKKLF